MVRKIFYITDYWRVLKICARIHIEAYGLGGGFIVDASVDDNDDDYGRHLFRFTNEGKKIVSLFQMVRSRMVNNLGRSFWRCGTRLKIARHSGDSTFNPIMISVWNFWAKQKKKIRQRMFVEKRKKKQPSANDYTPFGYTKIVWCIRVLLRWMKKIC